MEQSQDLMATLMMVNLKTQNMMEKVKKKLVLFLIFVGILTKANGKKYVGEFKNGSRNGKGVFTFPDGSRYEGDFKVGNFMEISRIDYMLEWKI